MNFVPAPLPGVFIIEPEVFSDPRGFFFESYNRKKFADAGIAVDFVQDNVSRSIRGTLRGLHYQLEPQAQGKLVRAVAGEVFDVVVDLRSSSAKFGKWFGYTLTAENRHALWIPPGFAHGFVALTDGAEFHYKCTTFYAPELDRSILWNDPEIGIQWPEVVDPSLLSKKDREAPLLVDAELNF